MAEELKPCAHCGGKAMVNTYNDDIKFPFIVECSECGSSSNLHPERRFAVMAWNRRAALRSTETEPSQEPVRDDLWALCYLHDWDPPIDGQEHRWEPGKNVFPAVHAFYRRWEDAEAIRKDMSNPEKYWVVRTKAECELRLSKAARVSPASPRPDREAEENERLRALIRQFSDVADFMDLETEGFDMSDKLALVYKNEDDEEVAHITNFDLRVFYECRAALAKEGK